MRADSRESRDWCNFRPPASVLQCSFVLWSFVWLSYVYRARLKDGPQIGEFCYCSCLPLLPGFACSIHATWGPPFSWARHICHPRHGHLWSHGLWPKTRFFYSAGPRPPQPSFPPRGTKRAYTNPVPSPMSVIFIHLIIHLGWLRGPSLP